MSMIIKKGDTVKVLSGKERGKQGVVEKTIPSINRVVITGVNIRKRHYKKSQSHPQGGIVEIPGSLNSSNVMVICPHCSKPTRVKQVISENGDKFRGCIHCNNSIDNK